MIGLEEETPIILLGTDHSAIPALSSASQVRDTLRETERERVL